MIFVMESGLDQKLSARDVKKVQNWELRCGMMGMIKKMVGCMNGKSIVSAIPCDNCLIHGAATAASLHARGVGTLLRAVEVSQKGTNHDAYMGC